VAKESQFEEYHCWIAFLSLVVLNTDDLVISQSLLVIIGQDIAADDYRDETGSEAHAEPQGLDIGEKFPFDDGPEHMHSFYT